MANTKSPVRDVKLLTMAHHHLVAVRHQMPPIRNVIGRMMESVVNTGPIKVRVARLGLGLDVSNTLIGDTR